MPPYSPPSDQWFANQLATLMRDVAALKTQRTQFVNDTSGNAQVIIGNLANDPSGNATGLSGFGIAVSVGSGWVRVLPNLVGGWIAPTLINSWVNTGGALETAGYLKDPLGFVHLKGIVQGGASNTVAFVLPAGYRPGATLKWTTSNTTPAIATVNIDTSGNATIFWTGTNGLNIGLSGFTFLAEN